MLDPDRGYEWLQHVRPSVVPYLAPKEQLTYIVRGSKGIKLAFIRNLDVGAAQLALEIGDG